MEATTSATAAAPATSAPACPYCGKSIETPANVTIIDRARDPVSRRAYLRQRSVTFCSKACGGNYQMGCEG